MLTKSTRRSVVHIPCFHVIPCKTQCLRRRFEQDPSLSELLNQDDTLATEVSPKQKDTIAMNIYAVCICFELEQPGKCMRSFKFPKPAKKLLILLTVEPVLFGD